MRKKYVSRFTAVKRTVRPAERDLEIYMALFVHGPLSVATLHALVAPDISINTFRFRIRKLFDDGKLEIPHTFKEAHDLYKSMVWDLTESALDILADGIPALEVPGRVTTEEVQMYQRIQARRTWFKHDLMASNITASVEIECKKRGWRYLSWIDIMRSKGNRTKAQPNPLSLRIKPGKEYEEKIPDGLFGIEHVGLFDFYALEADRTNERKGTEKGKYHSSVKKHIRKYRFVIRNGVYKDYGVPNLRVLFVSNTNRGMERAIDALKIDIKEAPDNANLCGPKPFIFGKLLPFSGQGMGPLTDGTALTMPYQTTEGPFSFA